MYRREVTEDSNNKESQWDNLQQYTNPIRNSKRISTRVYPHGENQVTAEHNREQNINNIQHNPMAFLTVSNGSTWRCKKG